MADQIQPAMTGDGRILIAGRDVRRMGFGTMRLPGIWGSQADRIDSEAILRRAVGLGVTLIDTAWYYGDHAAIQMIAGALRPYSEDLVIATKLGYALAKSGGLVPAFRPEQLRAGNESETRALKLEAIPLTHLRWVGAEGSVGGISFDEALGVLTEMRSEGRIEHIGLSNVSVDQLRRASASVPISSVSNAFSVGNQNDTRMVDECERRGIPYLPYFPLAGGLSSASTAMRLVMERLSLPPAQVNIAWLLKRSPMMIPIPGTSQLRHLEENVAATEVVLDEPTFKALSAT